MAFEQIAELETIHLPYYLGQNLNAGYSVQIGLFCFFQASFYLRAEGNRPGSDDE